MPWNASATAIIKKWSALGCFFSLHLKSAGKRVQCYHLSRTPCYCPRSSATTMIRRSPTRIQLKLDDLQEYESMRRTQELLEKSAEGAFPPTTEWTALRVSTKTSKEEIHERIGYVPQSRVS
uniref:Anaphase-promoting complex subunit CDC26 n=2 Tax=Timema TaxID=61471 RepID=A0A7R9DLM2_TIMPO|nr:unnamed protein product [Timema poppensis]